MIMSQEAERVKRRYAAPINFEVQEIKGSKIFLGHMGGGGHSYRMAADKLIFRFLVKPLSSI